MIYETDDAKDLIIDQVRRLAAVLGRTPTQDEFNYSRRTSSARTVRKYFGTWNQLLEAAGLMINLHRNIPNELIIKQLQTLAQELGKTPSSLEFELDSRTVSHNLVIRRFGTWNNLVRQAGLKVNRGK